MAAKWKSGEREADEDAGRGREGRGGEGGGRDECGGDISSSGPIVDVVG